jgi:hypothetical protein
MQVRHSRLAPPSLQFGTYYNIERAEGAAKWLVRLQIS